MPKPPLNAPRKQRTREHVLADLSANHVEKVALLCGFAVERLTKDYGLDLAIFTFGKMGFREDGVIWVQLKATDDVKASAGGTTFLVRLDRRDVLAWIAEVYPVVLVLCDARKDCAFWLTIQSHFGNPQAFAKLRGQTITVAIPRTNVMTESAMREIARQKAFILAPQGEQS